jgi:hypothetical protein
MNIVTSKELNQLKWLDDIKKESQSQCWKKEKKERKAFKRVYHKLLVWLNKE